ncbi:MAG TPA: serpin family protein [Tepidisphaeraceae bacterium]|jgi:serpin B|nr:serpin family protein [Tepidisphaeraceae bacterium]
MRTIGVLIVASLVVCGGLSVLADQPPATQPIGAAAPVDRFAADLYGRLAPAQGNVLCSPLSIYTALMMTAAGARGDTAREMSTVLHVPDASSPEVHTAAESLLNQLQSSQKNFQLHIANALWAQEGFKCLPAFQNLMLSDYHTDLLRVDFHDQQSACGTINDWVARQTEAKILQLFSPGSLPAETRMVLANAIYFKAVWRSQFSPGRTQPGGFHVDGKADTQSRAMMHTAGVFELFQNDQLQALQLPYKGNKVAMLILLPRSIDGLHKLESNLSAKMLADLVGGLAPVQVDVAIPKFKFAAQIGLAPTLSEMGMGLAFTRGRADFSGIDGDRDLFISAVLHKAYIAVDEEGTEAAAATGIVMMPTVAFMPRNTFTADHPFLFIIRDQISGAMLFIGRVEDPTSK